MPGIKEIRVKIKSVQNTRKVTRALEMVSASKIRKAQERMKASRPYARMMRQIAQGIDLCVTVTQLNAIVVARSSFNSSMNYESVMIFGVARLLEESEKDVALERITEKLVPGLSKYGRPLVSKEIAATMIVELSLNKISAKSREGDPLDDDEDVALPIWAGILPIETKLGAPITAANAAGIAVPSHIAT